MSRRDEVLKPFHEKRGLMEERVREGIEKNRKSDGTVFVTDRSGSAVPGVTVLLRQRSHEFRYGANLFLLDELETEEKNEAYKRLYRGAFNMATLPFYWYSLEPERGKPRYAADSPKYYRRPAPDLCVAWCEENGIMPKAHCLNYDKYAPVWLPRDVSAVRELLTKRMRECAERYAGRIPSWEVINETLCDGVDLPERRSTVLANDPEVVEWSFAAARRFFPNNELVINESSPFIWEQFKYNRTAYYMQIERALSKGASIDAVGMQFHMFFEERDEAHGTGVYYDPERIYAVLDQFADFGLPVQITEISIPAYHETGEDEALQAEILRNIYSMWFSHASVEMITYWNTVDGYAYRNPNQNNRDENHYLAGLIRHDMTPKPAYRTISDLFKKEWHTDTETVTGDGGAASFRGFRGDYDVTLVLPDGRSMRETLSLKGNAPNRFRFIV